MTTASHAAAFGLRQTVLGVQEDTTTKGFERYGLLSPFDRIALSLDRETAVEDNAPLVVNVFVRPCSTFL